MDKRIEDYLHLYLGCEVIPTDGGTETYVLSGVEDGKPLFKTKQRGFAIQLFQWQLAIRPLSDMKDDEVNHCWELLDWSKNITTPQNRRTGLNEEFLDSEEGRECGWFSFCKILPYLLKQGFDLFDLIPAGLAIDKTKMNTNG